MNKKTILSVNIDGKKKKQSFKSKPDDKNKWRVKVEHKEDGIYQVKFKIEPNEKQPF